MNDLRGASIHITGIVQGVGFRPFVYGLARRYSLTGWVRNTSAGVDIEVDGPETALRSFVEALQVEVPPLARIDHLTIDDRDPDGFTEFTILTSKAMDSAFQPISPDVSICEDCLVELFDPDDRRYRYPFINCTNCGPRFTIIEDIPYDRPKTTMKVFPMCEACSLEYEDPLDRRFHAQPVACRDCGPTVWLQRNGRVIKRKEDALQEARAMLKNGEIVAVKGLGGFHLACDATQQSAVNSLRERKLRVDKPFAVMFPSLETVRAHCELTEEERRLLTSRERPIVILNRKKTSSISPVVTPGQSTLGVMLPYTPLHELLLEPEEGFPEALVMTSGNVKEEPIVYTNDEALERLDSLADGFLLHDREIHTRCDDSVTRVILEDEYPIRRSRGSTPFPILLPWSNPPILAVGAELKNAFCLTKEQYAFLSHHIGDMENFETLQSFEKGVAHFERLFRITPEVLAYDLHPDYLATRYALERGERAGLKVIGVQHHHAHIAAGMAEHCWEEDRPVIGVSFDGTGYGEDGAIWGGEYLVADYNGYQRPYHLKYIPLAGGEASIRNPWRLGLTWLMEAGIDWTDDLPPVKASDPQERRILQGQLDQRLNTPLTSSMGRLFDAVSALLGIRAGINYEAQAAIEMEALVDPTERREYPFQIVDESLDPGEVFHAVVDDLRSNVPISIIASRFHNSVSAMVLAVCKRIADEFAINDVFLSGGVWQNKILLERTVALLMDNRFEIYLHKQVPTNDGGLALGQAAIAAHRLLGE